MSSEPNMNEQRAEHERALG
jgi:hypothetical protein